MKKIAAILMVWFSIVMSGLNPLNFIQGKYIPLFVDADKSVLI